MSYTTLLAQLRFLKVSLFPKFAPQTPESADNCLLFILHQVVLLTALIISAAASAAGVFEAFQLSMYLRVLVPVVFTR